MVCFPWAILQKLWKIIEVRGEDFEIGKKGAFATVEQKIKILKTDFHPTKDENPFITMMYKKKKEISQHELP